MMDCWERIGGLYRDSPCPVLTTEADLTVRWANQAALDRYPVLSLPGALSLLFSEAQLVEITAAGSAGARVISPVQVTRVGFYFVPISHEGYFVSIGPLEGKGSGEGLLSDPLTATITNQMKTPLSSIFASLFSMARLPEAEPGSRLFELIEQINRDCYQMLRFSLDFNTYLQDATGNRSQFSTMLDLTEMLTQLGQAAQMLTRTAGIPMSLSLPEAPVCVEADEQRLSHALLHIISNCCRFTQEGNEIQISLEVRGEQAQISISDRGLGIPEELLDRICTPFFSHDPEGMPYAGSGLGLSIVRHVVAQYGGSFAVSSKEGEGTTVAVSLPICEPGRLVLKSPEPLLDLLRDRFSLVHIILSDSCGVPKL